MRYFVVALRWSEAKRKQVNVIVGSFEVYHLACLFRDAYNSNYNAGAFVVDANRLANAIEE